MSAFCHTHRVTFADCTVGNHVYYARYLHFLEAARGEFFRHLGSTLSQWQDQDVIFPVIECHLRYKTPARYDDVLAIELRPTAAKGARLNFSYRVLRQDGPLLVDAERCTSALG
jgi:acyl-CoA thioester hydrolase